jgi:hypothetical protein
MMADRKRLVALVLAQCAAFAAVLILAAFTGHGPSTAKPGPTTTPGSSSGPHTSSPPASPSPSASPHTSSPSAVQFTVTAKATPSSSKFQNTPVVTYDAGTLKQVVSGRLGSNNSVTETVQAEDHAYLVCLSPPQGWKSTGDTFLLDESICKYLPPAATERTVSFTFQPVSSSGVGGTR